MLRLGNLFLLFLWSFFCDFILDNRWLGNWDLVDNRRRSSYASHWWSEHRGLAHPRHHARPHSWRSWWSETHWHATSWSSRCSRNRLLICLTWILIISSCSLSLIGTSDFSLNVVISNQHLSFHSPIPQILAGLFKPWSLNFITLFCLLTFNFIYTALLLSLYYLDFESLQSSRIGNQMS